VVKILTGRLLADRDDQANIRAQTMVHPQDRVPAHNDKDTEHKIVVNTQDPIPRVQYQTKKKCCNYLRRSLHPKTMHYGAIPRVWHCPVLFAHERTRKNSAAFV
jgi:hypothetical protein